MEDLTAMVAQNLKRIREENKLSLDRLAAFTGVSKSMLGQIERGESSPTISTVWKIANGLKVSFTTLLNSPQPNTAVVTKTSINPLIEDSGKYRLFPFFPIEEGRHFEIYTIEIDPGGSLSAEPHPQGTQEFLTVFWGELSVSVENQAYRVAVGDSIHFKADIPHAYANASQTLCRANLVIQYAS